MRTINKEAWAILREEEQMAVSLKVGHSKSTWEAGEVMGRAHYKFLEIEGRARHFLKMFTEHFVMYECLIPDYIKIDPAARTYFESVILQRTTAKEGADLVNDPRFKVKAYRDTIIIDALKNLINSKKAIKRNIGLLIFEFDRWNNWRVLPITIQEPSAFKRRNKNNDKRNIKNLISLNDYQLEKVIERFEKKDGTMFMPLPAKLDDGKTIIRVREKSMEKLSKIGFFIFTKENKAQEFYDLIQSYNFFGSKSCTDGQKFWPKYRDLVRNSINYNAIGKRIASRKFLQSALQELDIETE